MRAGLTFAAATVLLCAQNPTPRPPSIMPPGGLKPQQPEQTPAQPPTSQQQQPATPTAPPKPVVPLNTSGAPAALNLQNASLVEVVDILARALKINYILDPRVKGSVTINTYGEIKPVDVRPLLETILRINGAAMVQVGDLYRIVPIADVARLPISPQLNASGKDLPDDERMILDLVFLKYATVVEMSKLLQPFLGEGAQMTSYEPANLMLILDNSRNMRRTLELIAMFDSDTLAGQRVRLFDVVNGRPSDVAKELEDVFKAFALSEKTSPIRFMPIDRINTIIAVAPNPGIFTEVEKWLKKLDIPLKVTAGSIDNYVYRLKYGRAEIVGSALMQLYGFGGGGYGGGYGGYGGFGSMMGGYGMGGGGYGMGTMPVTLPPPGGIIATPSQSGQTAGSTAAGTSNDLTGSYLTGSGYGYGGYQTHPPHPRIIPNPFDNTLLIQGTPQEWAQISRLIEQIDVAPRQVLIEAKIYEVDLTGAWSAGVQAFLQKRGPATDRLWSGSSNLNGLPGLGLTAGLLVGHTRELLAFLSTSEATTHAKVISAPTVIATDSIPASINVGQEVPTLTSQAVSGVQIGGTSQFANTISSRSTGVALNIMARVNSSGVVTMIINQEVSAPTPPPSGVSVNINSPSFSKRNVATQVTIQDNDTVSIGGIIQESDSSSSSGIPFLHRIPIVGAAFGNKSTSKARTELIVFLTPHVIYDTNQIADATEELKSKMKRLEKLIKE